MSNENASLPLKSLELPTKTVGKLKPLGLRTVGELYAHSIGDLVRAGLVERELVEIAEAAADFGITWSTPDEARKALASSAAPSATTKVAPAKDKKKPVAKKASRVALPDSFAAAFASDASSVSVWSPADVEAFLARKNGAEIVRLLRRMRVELTPTIGGKDRWVLDALLDVSLVAEEAASRIADFLLRALFVFEDEVKLLDIKRLASGHVGCNLHMTIDAKGQPKALALVEAHRAWIGKEASFARAVPYALLAIAIDGALASGEITEACALAAKLEAREVREIRLVCDAFRLAHQSRRGVAKLGAAIDKGALDTLVAPGAEQTLTAIARLCADANESDKAVGALRALFALEAKRPGVASLRAATLDDPTFASLRANASFKALFKRFPAFEAKLR